MRQKSCTLFYASLSDACLCSKGLAVFAAEGQLLFNMCVQTFIFYKFVQYRRKGGTGSATLIALLYCMRHIFDFFL